MPNAVSNVSFQSPGYDYGADIADIERKRALAAALQNESLQGGGGTEVVNGWAVRKPLDLSKIAQSITGAYGQKKAGEEQRALAEKSQRDYQQMLATGLKQLRGTAATPVAEDASGNVTPAQAAIAPDPAAALGTFGSHPMGAQMVPVAMQQIQQEQRNKALAGILRGGDMNAQPQHGPGLQQAGGQPGGAQGGPNLLAGMPPQVVALMTSGDPELVKLGTTLMEANKGIAQRPGAPVVNPFTGAVIAQPTPSVPAGVGLNVGPSGPQAYNVPGAIPAMAAATQSQAGATEAGKAPYQLGVVNTAGSPTLMTHEQQIQAATGQPMPQPGAQPQTIPAPRPGTPDYDAYKRVASGEVPSAYVPSVMTGQGGIPNLAQQAGRQQGLRLQDQGQSRAQVEMGEGLGKRYNAIQDAGFSANQKMQKFERLGGLLSSIDTGKLTPAGTELAAWAKSAGYNVDEKLDNAQAAKALSNEMALELRNPAGGAGMPGAMSDADRNYLQSLISSLDKTPGANKLLLEGMSKLAQRDREVAQLARDYKKKNGEFDDGFYDELAKFSDKNPLFKQPKGGGAALQSDPQKLFDEARRRGLIK